MNLFKLFHWFHFHKWIKIKKVTIIITYTGILNEWEEKGIGIVEECSKCKKKRGRITTFNESKIVHPDLIT